MIYSRPLLKENAKAVLRTNYWEAVGVCLVFLILSGDFLGVFFRMPEFEAYLEAWIMDATYNTYGYETSLYYGVFLIIILFGLLVLAAVMILFSTFVRNILAVGTNSYFIKSRMGKTSFSELFAFFTNGRYWNVLKVQFLTSLFISLWSLLLVVPGIIKSYEYLMVPYILAENPDIHYKEAMAQSKDMMYGFKMEAFVLSLSFIGWMILASLTCGIGVIFLNPYIEATYAEFYEFLKANLNYQVNRNYFK